MSYTLTAREQARLDSACDRILASARANNWPVTRDQVETLPSVRIFALSPDTALEGWESEVRNIDSVADAIRNAETVAAIQNGGEVDPLQGMNAEQKINFARANGLDGTRKENKPKLSAEEQKAALQKIWQMPNAQERLNAARRLGIGG